MKRRPPLLDKPVQKYRAVSPEERKLWQEATQGPLPATTDHSRQSCLDTGGNPEAEQPPYHEKSGVDTSHIIASSRKKPATRIPASYLDKPTLAKLRRGTLAIDATLDLHGHTRETAHGILTRFIAQAQVKGFRAVVVITGKGRSGAQGILRELLPRWLNESPLRERIIAYDSAHARHGGSGAWYIRIRKTSPS